MRILNEATGYIGREYASYGKDIVESYLGDSVSHLYLNFALEDSVIKQILDEYSSAGARRKQELVSLYRKRVNSLIKAKDFCIKREGKQSKLPSIEVDDHSTPGYLIGTFCNDMQKFIDNGSVIYVPRKYYSSVRIIQRVEMGFSEVKRMAGFFCIPCEISDFRFFIVTRKKDLENKYYLEEVSIDYEKNCCVFDSRFLTDSEFKRFKKGLKEL